MSVERRPPTLAVWLLRQLLAGDMCDSLIGDLSERHAHGKSTHWFWRQAVLAIVAQGCSVAKRERFLALRGVLVGFLVLIPSYYGVLEAYRTLGHTWVERYARQSESVAMLWYFYQVPLLAAWWTIGAIAGWAAAHSAATQKGRVVLLSAVLQVPLVAWWSWPVWVMANGQAVAYYSFPMRVVFFAILLGMPVSTLFGGFVAVGRLHNRSRPLPPA